ncbi:hypothetical protein J4G37_16825 [Microvirga sp. 3-52]|nr:hypothetical protein [Microvirga sp. 3-52]
MNWAAEDNTWLLLLDPKLNSRPFVSHIISLWHLPTDRLKVMTDPHYRSSEQVGPPPETIP